MPSNNQISKIVSLAARLPSGPNDPKAGEKLLHEQQELIEKMEEMDFTGAALEVADVAYYAVKAIEYAAQQIGVSANEALYLAIEKYQLRARPGNPKNDDEERFAINAALRRFVK